MTCGAGTNPLSGSLTHCGPTGIANCMQEILGQATHRQRTTRALSDLMHHGSPPVAESAERHLEMQQRAWLRVATGLGATALQQLLLESEQPTLEQQEQQESLWSLEQRQRDILQQLLELRASPQTSDPQPKQLSIQPKAMPAAL